MAPPENNSTMPEPSRSLPARAVGLSVALAAALAAPAAGSGATVPKKVQIADPAGDANFLNDNSLHQASTGTVPDTGDVGTPADASAEADLLAVWFTNDAKNLTVHVQTEAPPTAETRAVYFVAANPRAAGDWGCLLFAVRLNDPAQTQPQIAYLRDQCSGDTVTQAELGIAEMDDGSGHLTLTLPRSASGYFANGGVISAPVADARLGAGFPPVTDDTARGSDYRIRKAR